MINASVEELTKCVADVPQKPDYQQYILECSGNLTQCSTVDEFFATLCSSYSNYLLYQLFEKVVTHGNSMLMSDMEKYKKKLTSITTVARVQELNDRSVCIRNSTADCEVLIAVQIPFSDCRISDIEEVRDEIRRISYMFEFCHTLCEISGDSNTTTTKWLISNVYSRHLQVDLLLSTIPLRRKLFTKNDAPQQLLMAFGVMKICIDGLCVFESDPNCKENPSSIISQCLMTSALKSPTLHVYFSSLQISGMNLHSYLACLYKRLLIASQLRLSIVTTQIFYLRAMLPPACDYANTIVQKHPSITEVNEAELKDLEETIPSTLRLPASVLEDTIEMEQMDVDGVVANVARLDERFKAIEEVLRASNDELEQKSNSEDYWKKQEQVVNDLMLDEWKDYFNTQAYMASTASATIVTWGSAAPFSVGFGAAVAAGAGSAVIGGVYDWNTYEQIGRKNVDRFSEHERMDSD
ncbi:hypothetical protein EMCRGX_G033823 [Ephydatia muelleri]